MTPRGTSGRPVLPLHAPREGDRPPTRPRVVAWDDVPPPAPIRSLGFAAFRLLGPPPGDVGPTSPPTLVNRFAEQSVIAEALRIHDGDPPRSWWGRLVGTSPLSPQVRPWFQGALGEIAVGEVLGRLGPEWTVLHAVPVGAKDSDIDHVLIGPGGVFTLNTKNHSGQTVWVGEHAVFVAGQKQHYLRHARHEARRAAKRLDAAVGEAVPVVPVLVLVEPKTLTIRQRPADVHVVTERRLLRWLQRRRPVLTPEQIARITAAAVAPGTWHDAPAPSEDPVVLQQAFADLRLSVRGARRRRELWRFAGPLAVLGLVFGPGVVEAVLGGL